MTASIRWYELSEWGTVMLHEHFKETLRSLCTLIEDMAIENQIYTEVILKNLNISHW
jgi:hypothetical protein